MVTFLFAIAEHYMQHDFSGWLYVLPAFLDLALIDRISGFRKGGAE